MCVFCISLACVGVSKSPQLYMHIDKGPLVKTVNAHAQALSWRVQRSQLDLLLGPTLQHCLPPVYTLHVRPISQLSPQHLQNTKSVPQSRPAPFIRSFSSIFLLAVRIISSLRLCSSACRSFLFCDHVLPDPVPSESVLFAEDSAFEEESFEARL